MLGLVDAWAEGKELPDFRHNPYVAPSQNGEGLFVGTSYFEGEVIPREQIVSSVAEMVDFESELISAVEFYRKLADEIEERGKVRLNK